MDFQMEVIKMEIKKVTVHELKSSYFVYLPKIWVLGMKIKKGDKLSWHLIEGEHVKLEIRKIREV